MLFSVTGPLSSLLVVLLNHSALLAGVLAEHCHQGYCGAHLPLYVNAGAVVALSGISAALVLLVFALLGGSLHLNRRRFRLLEQLTETQAGQRLRVIDTPAMLACCVGLWRPKVFVSRQLTQQLSAVELQAGIAHEQAHAYRWDNLKNLMLRWVTLLWPPATGRRIRQDYRRDADLACDQFAARHSDPQALRAALLKMAGEQAHRDRFQQLEKEKDVTVGTTRQNILLCVLLFLCVGLVFVLLNAAHMGIEWLGERGHR